MAVLLDDIMRRLDKLERRVDNLQENGSVPRPDNQNWVSLEFRAACSHTGPIRRKFVKTHLHLEMRCYVLGQFGYSANSSEKRPVNSS